MLTASGYRFDPMGNQVLLSSGHCRERPQVSRRFARWLLAGSAGLLCSVLLTGCHTLHTKPVANYQTVQANPNRNTKEAKRLHQKALDILGHCAAAYDCECIAKALCNPCEAERHLQDALIADVRFGPAHNTLGTLYLGQHKLYLAAWEFEYASGLMPERAEPLNNLGLVYEEAGRLGLAIENYEEAAALEPTSAQYIGNLARASLKQGTPLDEVRYLLKDLLLYDSRPGWLAWARELLGTNMESGGKPRFEEFSSGAAGEEFGEEAFPEEAPVEVEPIPMPPVLSNPAANLYE